jgi:Na+/H+-translocating membrane pyrophosphatase
MYDEETDSPNPKEAPDTKEKLTLYVTLMVSFTLCISVLAMVTSFMLGLWAKEVDNAEIFKMISPAFSTLIGGMIGFLSGIKLMQNEDTKPKDPK